MLFFSSFLSNFACFTVFLNKMFKFLKDQDEDEPGASKVQIDLRPAAEVVVKDVNYEISEKVESATQTFGNFEPKFIQIKELAGYLKENDKVRDILNSSSDLISGTYEGGFKIWECTVDLIKYLQANEKGIGEKTKVLDLGCGSGLLGLYALHKGADVDFQDYNSEVLEYLTIPNVILNFKDAGLLRSRFYSGDWGALETFWKDRPGNKYDAILSAETIYNLDYLPSLLRLVKTSLKPGGTLYLAAKTYYFGVGGSTSAFQDLVKKDGTFKSEVVHVLREGVQREIIKVTLISDS